MIKPTSPTPQHLQKLKLSYLDQLANSFYVPLVFFYQADEVKGLTTSNHVQISQRLKHSLSQTLTSFYPLAGRKTQDNFVVDCNDAGVEFIVARVRATLKDGTTAEEFMNKYIPSSSTPGISHTRTLPLLLLQITLFDCGGFSVGMCFSHIIADCASATAFVNAWAATCRGDDNDQIPRFSFNLANYFPSRDFPTDSAFEDYFKSNNEKLMMKRFVFDKVKLEALRQRLANKYVVKDPSRVELVSAFICKHFMINVRMAKSGKKTNFAALHGVNLRARKSPPQLENVFGNCVMLAIAITESTTDDDDQEFHGLVRKLRNSIWMIDDDYITESQSGYSYLNDVNKFHSLITKGHEVEWCSFSSWCRFPVYEVDYGWGNPVWVGTTTLPLKNVTVLMDTRCGEGIEAWVNMSQHNLEALQTQFKLISTDIIKNVES
ncbi:hypothetical protein DH2020_027732 [Rehmannia glutinosa]|uniref:Vinorine synthase-like n=1 Tax=Rehmannia glutinosa TaxID=99300 RepID=A0ABR0VWY5_REHGL